jgi:hypothetical protein
MKYIISERQFSTLKSFLVEQKDFKMDFSSMSMAPGFPARKETGTTSENMWGDQHTANLVFGIASAFIPVIGPFISAGIGLADAALYAKQGDPKTAGMIAMFSLLPGVGAIANRIPVIRQLGVKGMSALASKLSKGQKITDPIELQVINGIIKNVDLVKSSLNTQVKTMAQQASTKPLSSVIKSGLSKLGKEGLKLVGLGVGYDVGYDATTNYFGKKKEEEDLKKFQTSIRDKD